MSIHAGYAASPAVKRKTVLVAGGAGFLGSFLCEDLIAKGAHVVCLDNFRTGTPANVVHLRGSNRFSLIEADICDGLPPGLAVDEIFNLACPASPRHYQADPVRTMMTSVVGTHNLLELAAGCGARMVQASTSEIYGDPHQHPQPETYWGNVNPTGIRACYDEGKRAAETLCFDFLRQRSVDVRVARIFNTYGPRMQPDDGRIISNFVVQALSGQPLTVYGTGLQTRSFCYVTDLISGLQTLMGVSPNPATPINIGNPEEHTVKALAQIVRRMTRSSSPIVLRPLPADDPRCRRPDIAKARDILGWMPRTSLRDGLKSTIAWFAATTEKTHHVPLAVYGGAGAGLVPGAVAKGVH